MLRHNGRHASDPLARTNREHLQKRLQGQAPEHRCHQRASQAGPVPGMGHERPSTPRLADEPRRPDRPVLTPAYARLVAAFGAVTSVDLPHVLVFQPGGGVRGRLSRPRRPRTRPHAITRQERKMDFTRRWTLAAAAISVAGLNVVAAGPAHAATTPARECWGSDRGDWDAFHKAVPQSNCVRVYYDTENVFPKTWPQRAGNGSWSMLSIRPNPADLLAGNLDAELKPMIDSAPTHSL